MWSVAMLCSASCAIRYKLASTSRGPDVHDAEQPELVVRAEGGYPRGVESSSSRRMSKGAALAARDVGTFRQELAFIRAGCSWTIRAARQRERVPKMPDRQAS